MDRQRLKETLKSLHTNLEATPDVDVELRALLQELDHDIHHLLQKEGSEASDSTGIITRAQAISARLAVRHPHLEPSLREVADTLARMGI